MVKGKELIFEKDEALGNLIRLFHSGGVGIKIFPHVTRISFCFCSMWLRSVPIVVLVAQQNDTSLFIIK